MINLREKIERSLLHLPPTVLYNVDETNISPSEIVNIAPGEGRVSFTLQRTWEALAFPKDYFT